MLMVLFVALQSRSSGPGGTANLQVTGAPGSVGSEGTCANTGCHNAGSFSPNISIELLDGTDPVSVYQPGKAYTLRVSVAETDGSPTGYGFQAASLDGSDNQAGTWGTLGSGTQTTTLSSRDYLEHSSMADVGTFESEWIAPAAGTGDVTVYAAGIAANGNGGATGDGTAAISATIGEDPVNSTYDPNSEIASMDIFPNPVNETLNLQINSRITGDYTVRILDLMGKVVTTTAISLQNGEQINNIPVNHLSTGMYVVQLSGAKHLAAVQMLKK